jgi:hypothetical protein
LPHSDIRGSQLADSSPRLNAAYHVLHRLLAPRHPPYTLTSSARIASTRQAGRIGSISLIFDAIDCSMHRLFRCHHSSVVKVLARAPAPRSRTNKNGLAPARPLAHKANAYPGQGPRCSPYSERVCSLVLPCRCAATVIYTPSRARLQPAGPILFRLPSERNGLSGWAFLGSNQGPQSYQDCALTS